MADAVIRPTAVTNDRTRRLIRASRARKAVTVTGAASAATCSTPKWRRIPNTTSPNAIAHQIFGDRRVLGSRRPASRLTA